VQVRQLELRQFRCFKQLNLEFTEPMTLITGPNGSGKTSILEALHYLCYLRSFRSPSPRHLVNFDQDSFFLRADVEDLTKATTDEIKAGFSAGKRLVKLNQRPICSYKELVDYYRVITITEDALDLIKGGPEERRSFLDQAIMLYEPEYTLLIRNYRQILENRNSLLAKGTYSLPSYRLWTEQLWEKSAEIQHKRILLLEELVKQTNLLLNGYFDEKMEIELVYRKKRVGKSPSLDDFLASDARLMDDEGRYGRTLFGAHLDDFSVNFQSKKSKMYASRGQQKLIMVLLKIAQLQDLTARKGPALLLLDDFMTDFDKKRGSLIIHIVAQLNCQTIFTCPLQQGTFEELLLEKGVQKIELNL